MKYKEIILDSIHIKYGQKLTFDYSNPLRTALLMTLATQKGAENLPKHGSCHTTNSQMHIKLLRRYS